MGINSLNSQFRGLGLIFGGSMMENVLKMKALQDSLKIPDAEMKALVEMYGKEHNGAFPTDVTIFKAWLDSKVAAVAPTTTTAPATTAPTTTAPTAPTTTAPAPTTTAPAPPTTTTAPTLPPKPTAEELADIKKKEDQKKMLMYGGIGVGVLLLGVGIWYATKE